MAQIILDSNNNLIQGDFDNATLNNRTKLQTTTTNATTNVYVAPNGSATSAGVSVANNSSLTNASKIVMATNGTTDTQIISGINGSGTYLPLSFYTNNALAAQITTAGNLNLTGGLTVGATAAPAFSAYNNANQTLNNNTNYKVAFQVEEFDTNNNFDNTTNYRFTPTVAGYYQINAQVLIENNSNAGTLLCNVFKNGADYKSTQSTVRSGSNTTALCSSVIYLNGSTDYVEVYVLQATGATATLITNTTLSTWFNGAFVRSA
jgi:hypothetical protein